MENFTLKKFFILPKIQIFGRIKNQKHGPVYARKSKLFGKFFEQIHTDNSQIQCIFTVNLYLLLNLGE